jgi:uncharacterized membrane protein YfbV (UPF0208 family)
MNKFFKQKSKYETVRYLVAALSLIIGEAIKDILQNTTAHNIGHGILWFFFTIAVFAMTDKIVYKKVDAVICVAALTVIAIFSTFFTMKGLFALGGVFTAALLCNLVGKSLKKNTIIRRY